MPRTVFIVLSNLVITAAGCSGSVSVTTNSSPVAPSITSQPTSQTVTAGQTASFTVIATGTPPLSYQWKKSGTAIPGATSSSYTTPATSSSDSGIQFTVVVSNTVASVASDPATLSVNSQPRISITPTNVNFGCVVIGAANTQTATLTNSGGANLTVSQATVSGSDFSLSGLTLPLTLRPGQTSNFNVAFAPTGAGSVTGSIAVTSSGVDSPSTMALSGVGATSGGASTINVANCGATGNGSTDDTTAINSAIATLTPGATLFFPCGTYKISSGLTAITTNNVTLYGQTGCSSGTVTINSTASGSTILQVGSSQSLSSPTPVTATTADLDQTFQANFAVIGTGVGDYVYLEEAVSSSDTTHTNCGGSGCRGEVLKITGLSGNTATVETAVHHAYDTSCCVPWVQKLLNPVSGVTLHDLLLDGSGAATYALAVLDAVNLTVTNLTAQNVSCSAIAAVNGYNDSYANITITHAGTNNGCSIGGSAVSLRQQGNLNVNGISISNMNVGAFGFIPYREANGMFSNISVDATGTGSGRPFKTNSSAHNIFNNISVNHSEAAYYQGITIEYFSHHNVWNACKVTNNVGSPNNSGIALYGDVANGNHQGNNHYNTFNNCTVTGNAGYQVVISDNNDHTEINGGIYTGVAGQYVIAFDDSSPCCTANAYIHNAFIGGPGSTGVYIENGSPDACINNNTFGPGLTTAIDVTASSDIGFGNVLNGLLSNLTPGSCGAGLP